MQPRTYPLADVDVWPDDAPNWPGDATGFKVAGYQQLLRGEPFRGKFRQSFEKPVPFVPNQPERLRFQLPDIAHTFRAGHRIMVQVQSTWFPVIDRNPQRYVENIFKARDADFRKARQRVFRSRRFPSHVTLPVMKAQGDGRVVMVLTQGVEWVLPTFGAYTSSKAALAHMVKMLATELGQYGICVNGVNPDGVVRGSGKVLQDMDLLRQVTIM